MDFFVIIGLVFVIYFINKMAIKTAVNSQNEEVSREINRKILQNRKLDELYGRDSGNPVQQISKAIHDIKENKRSL